MRFLQVEVNRQNYLIDTDCVLELIHYETLTSAPNTTPFIEGIISYKDKVVPIITLRKLLGFTSFKDEQLSFIKKVENQHVAWVKEFETSLTTGIKFTKALDSHKCELGKWIDKTLACLRCNNNGFVDLLSEKIINHHASLHDNGRMFLQQTDGDVSEKIKLINKNAEETINGLHIIESKIDKLTSAFEQIVLMNVYGIEVGIVVDRIDKTHELEEKTFFTSNENMSPNSKYIQFIDYYEIDKKLMFSMKFTGEFQKLLKNEE